MRLRPEFITQTIEGSLYLVPIGGEQFNGFVRINQTGAFIIECLKEDTTEEKIVEEMLKRYKAPRDMIEADVKETINKLQQLNAIEK